MGIKMFAFLTLSFMIAYSSGIKVTLSLESQSTDPTPLEFDVAYLTPVIEMMKVATSISSDYEFGGSYGRYGWFIETYNGISNDLLITHYCWAFYVQLPGGSQEKPNVGVSAYQLVTSGTEVTFKYEYSEYCREYPKDSESKTEL